MFKVIKARLDQKYRTTKFPEIIPEMTDRYRGLPVIDSSRCIKECTACIDICPVDAVEKKSSSIDIDLGKCIFCGKCAEVCTENSISFSRDFSMAVNTRSDLLVSDNDVLKKAEKTKKRNAENF